MSDVLMSLIGAVTPVLFTGMGGVCGWLWKSHRKEEAKDKAIEDGMRVLLHAELLAIYQRHVDGHVPISLRTQEEADSIYLIYHDKLGGNGTGTELHRKIMALPAYVDHGGSDDDAT